LAQSLSPEMNRFTRLHQIRHFVMAITVTPPRTSSFAMDQKAAPRLWMSHGRATAGEGDRRRRKIALAIAARAKSTIL
jgi:hypothetical protein